MPRPNQPEQLQQSESFEDEPVAPRNSPWQAWLWGVGLVLLAALVYWPTLGNGFISDGEPYVATDLASKPLEGLENIWLTPGTHERYEPLTLSTFWAEYQLWGLTPRGYHVVNLLLHAASAVLVWRLLARLAVPGAWLAAAVFAVHPVEVESVAWVSQRRNVLSCVLALGSLLAYLRFSPPATSSRSKSEAPSEHERWAYYALALGLFIAALLSNSITATVPAVLIVIYAWKRGQVTSHDAARLAPFFVLGLAFCGATAGMAKTNVGASGQGWHLDPLQRAVDAGHAFWFYAGKLVWPDPLIFYPHWATDERAAWQYLFPAAALALLVGLWLVRKRVGRGALAGALVFAGVLAAELVSFGPATLHDSDVTDRYQYHASIALFALAAAAGALVVDRVAKRARWLAPVAGAGVLLLLGVMAEQRTHAFTDQVALNEDVIARDPRSWIAHRNLGIELAKQKEFDGATAHCRKVIEILEDEVRDNPAVSETQDRLARGYVDLAAVQKEAGRPADAVASHGKAIEIQEKLARAYPTDAKYQVDAANGYVHLGSIESETSHGQLAKNAFGRAIEIREQLAADHPAVADYQDDLASCYVHLGLEEQKDARPAEAEAAHRKAIEIRAKLARVYPTVAKYQTEQAASYVDIGLLDRNRGREADAESAFRKAIEIREKLARDNPNVGDMRSAVATSYVDLGVLQRELGRTTQAVASCRQAVEIREKLVAEYPAAKVYREELALNYAKLGILQQESGRPAEAADSHRKAIEIREKLAQEAPDDSQAQNNLAASYVDLGNLQRDMGRPADAEGLFQKAIEVREKLVRDHPTAADLDSLAWSYVQLASAQQKIGRPTEAEAWQRKAIEIREKLTQDNPSSSEYRNSLAGSLADLGIVQCDLGRSADGVALCQKSVDMREKLVRENPNFTNYQVGLGHSYAALGAAQTAAARPPEAVTAYRKAIYIRAKLVQDNPTMVEYEFESAQSCRDIAQVLRATGQIADAEIFFRAAIEIHEKLIADSPRNPVYRSNLASDLTLFGEVLAQLGNWTESAGAYAKAVEAGNDSWQTMTAYALAQLAAGDEAGYRATCAELLKRHGEDLAPEAAFSVAFTLVVGPQAPDEMNQTLALAESVSTANPASPLATVLAGAAQYRAGRVKDATATLARALGQVEPATPNEPGQTFVCRMLGHMVLALAYQEQADLAARHSQMETLRGMIENPDTPAVPLSGSLPPWTVESVVEIAKRELAKLGGAAVGANK